MMRPALLALIAAALALAARRRPALQILRVSRVVADLDRAEAFYRDALGFRRVGAAPVSAAEAALLGLPGATGAKVVMQLGEQEIALVHFDPSGPPYPAGSRSNDLWFQHLAIVVDDMDSAYRRLMEHAPQPISVAGPVTLPPRNGSVTAFKFRDPDGHPLELIHFPPGQGRPAWHRKGAGLFKGIDHSALAVGDTARSLRFYRRLGFRVDSRTLNYGPAQAQLDGLPDARVQVTGLSPRERPKGHLRIASVPGLELLGYDPPGRPGKRHPADAVVTDWVTILTTRLTTSAAQVVRDPDGHLLLLVGRDLGARNGQAGPRTARGQRDAGCDATAPACGPLT